MRFLTCSNSCPRWDDGGLLPRSPGGLVPMLISLLQAHGGHWIFTAPPTAAPGADDGNPVRVPGDTWLHPLDLPEQVRQRHYDTISIGLFLGMLHYLHDTSAEPVFGDDMLDAWAAYESVNRSYAKRLAGLAENSPGERILVNDPHLMMVPEFLAAEFPRRTSRLTCFLGTPWCEPDYFCVLPGWLRGRLLRSLLRCDVVGFHCDRWADAFLACCARFLPEAQLSGRSVTCDGRTTLVVAEPFPVDVRVLERMRDDEATARWQRRLAELAQGRKVLVRADRLDLWKNLPRGFLAYEQLLRRRPEMAADCWFVAVVSTPSRAAERQRAYQARTEAVVRRINARFGAPGRDAVSLVYPERDSGSRNCVAAALTMSHAAMTNPTYDGLNLFAKEAAVLLDDRAPLLLSANAGAYQQLGPYSTELDPFDLDQTSSAMESALAAGWGEHQPERQDVLRHETPDSWLRAVFPDWLSPGRAGPQFAHRAGGGGGEQAGRVVRQVTADLERRVEAVRAMADQAAQAGPQPGQLGADRNGVAGVAVQVGRQFRGRVPARGSGEQEQDLGLARAQHIPPRPARRDGHQDRWRRPQVEPDGGGTVGLVALDPDEPAVEQRLEPAPAQRRDMRHSGPWRLGEQYPVGREQPGRRGHPAVPVDDDGRLAADASEQRRRHPAELLDGVAMRRPQHRLGMFRHRADQRERAGMGRRGRAAHVDHAEQAPVNGIADGGRGAHPRVQRVDEMLGGEHLERTLHDQRRPHPGGADGGLEQRGPHDESGLVGPPSHRRAPFPPQQMSLVVDDRHDMHGRVGAGGQALAQDLPDLTQRCQLAAALDVARVGPRHLGQCPGVESAAPCPPPGVGDHRSQPAARLPARHRLIPDAGQLAGVPPDIATCAQRALGTHTNSSGMVGGRLPRVNCHIRGRANPFGPM